MSAKTQKNWRELCNELHNEQDSDGNTWEVRSSNVALGEHVGHTVTATGVVSNSTAHNMKEDAKDAAKDSGMKKDDSEHGHMTVTDVKMVPESCKQ